MAIQQSPLLNLPAELRNMIWCLTLESPVIEIRTKNDLTRPSLLKVCQCITDDATKLYYGSNTFSLMFHPWDLTIPSLWLSSIVGPTNAAAICDLRIQLDWQAAKKQASRFRSEKYEEIRNELDEQARQNLHAFARELYGRSVNLKMVGVSVAHEPRNSDYDSRPGWITGFSRDMWEALEDATTYLIERRTECSMITHEYMSQTH